MSLILDALRKAEAERQRGQVPGLHGLPSVSVETATQSGSKSWRWPAVLGLLLAAGALAWVLVGRPGTAPVDMASVPTPTPPVAPSPALPLPAAAPAADRLPLVVSAPPPTVSAGPAAPPAEAVRPPAREAPIITQLRRLAELPPELRRELPPLVVSGSVWSEQAAARFVMLDGQLLREGDSLAPGLVLVKLAPKAATLRWRDQLIEVPL